MPARKTWLKLHRWTALALGMHWLLLALSGCLLIFHREVEAGLIGAPRAGITAPAVDAAIAQARAAGASDVKRVVIHDAPVRALRIATKIDGEPAILTFDARTGRLLSRHHPSGEMSRAGIMRGVYLFHQKLLLGDRGETLVAISGLFLLVTVVAGLIIGWPKRRQWRAALLPRMAGKPWHRLYAMHRAAGLLVAVSLISSAITGAGMVWLDPLRGALTAAGVAVPEPRWEPVQGAPRIGADDAIAAASRALPQAAFVRIDLPAEGARDYLVVLRAPGEQRAAFGTSRVRIDGRDGARLSIDDATRRPFGNRLLDGLFAIHNGEWLGLAGQLLLIAEAAGLAFLSGGGMLLWWWRRPRTLRKPAPPSRPLAGEAA